MYAYIDTETTGLDHTRHGIVQIAAIVKESIEGKVIDRFDININALSYRNEVDDKALEVHGYGKKQIEKFKDAYDSAVIFARFLSRYSRDTKLTFCGYNTRFDIPFVSDLLSLCKKKYSDYFSHRDLDVMMLSNHLRAIGAIKPKSGKLIDVCSHMNIITRKAHSATGDIEMTEKLHMKLVRLIHSHKYDFGDVVFFYDTSNHTIRRGLVYKITFGIAECTYTIFAYNDAMVSGYFTNVCESYMDTNLENLQQKIAYAIPRDSSVEDDSIIDELREKVQIF